MGDRMVEAEEEGMKTQPVNRVIAIAILAVTTYRMPHISGMHADLILAACLQTELHEGVLCGPSKGMEMGDSILSAIVHWR